MRAASSGEAFLRRRPSFASRPPFVRGTPRARESRALAADSPRRRLRENPPLFMPLYYTAGREMDKTEKASARGGGDLRERERRGRGESGEGDGPLARGGVDGGTGLLQLVEGGRPSPRILVPVPIQVCEEEDVFIGGGGVEGYVRHGDFLPFRGE